MRTLSVAELLDESRPTATTVIPVDEPQPLAETFALVSKLIVRLSSWSLGSHTLPESLYTFHPKTGTSPLSNLCLDALSHFADVARDTVWYADVYEEEDCALSGYTRGYLRATKVLPRKDSDGNESNEISDAVLTQDEERLRRTVDSWPVPEDQRESVLIGVCNLLADLSFVLRALRDVEVLHAIDLQSIYAFTFTGPPENPPHPELWTDNLAFLSTLLSVSDNFKALVNDTLDKYPVHLPQPPPTPAGTTYVDVTTTTFADGPNFTPTTLLMTTSGAPSRACTYRPAAESFATIFNICDDILTRVVAKLLIPPLSMTHAIEAFGNTPRMSIIPRSVFALCSYSRNQRVLGQQTIPELTGAEMLSLGVAAALVHLPSTIAFAADLGRLCYDRLRHLAWNDSRRRDMLLVDTINETVRSARVGDEVVARELGLPSCNYMVTVATIHGCTAICEFLTTMGVDGIACNNGYEGSVYEWLLEYYMKVEEEARGVAQRTRDALEKARIDGEIEKEKLAHDEAAKASKAKTSKKKGGKGKDKGFVPKSAEFYITEEERKLKVLHNVQSYFLTARLHCHRGTFRVYEGLKAHGVIPPTSYVFTTPGVVYDRTYAKLADVEYPPRPSHEDYKEGSVKFPNDIYKANDLFNMAAECYQQAVRVLEQLSAILEEEYRGELETILRFDTLKADVKEIKKTIVMNKIQMSKVAQLKKDVVRRVTIERRKEAKGLGVVNIM
jgi:hypothetical protein